MLLRQTVLPCPPDMVAQGQLPSLLRRPADIPSSPEKRLSARSGSRWPEA